MPHEICRSASACSLLPLSAAAQEAQTPRHSDDVRKSAGPRMGQGDRRFVLQAASSRHWRRRVGGGLGVGVGYDSPRGHALVSRRQKRWSTVRRYWSLEGEVGRRSLVEALADRRRSAQCATWAGSTISASGPTRCLTIEPPSGCAKRRSARVDGSARLRAVRLGGSVAAYMPDLGRANSRSVRSIEAVFTDGSVPGIRSRADVRPVSWLCRSSCIPCSTKQTCSNDPSRYRGAYQVAFEAVRDLRHRAGTTSIAGKRKCSSAFPASGPASV